MTVESDTDLFASVGEKVRAGERLSFEDGVALLKSRDLLSVGELADTARRRLAGDEVYFINNRHINHTNVCGNRCKFCAFSADEGAEDAYTMTLDEVLQRARESLDDGITELHIVGGEHPSLPYEYYLEMIAALHDLDPEVHLQAFTASEIAFFAKRTKRSEEEVLTEMKAAGLGSMPGGGAEIFAERVRGIVCDKKISGEKWLEVMRTAHQVGLKSNATMLYGHVETIEERIDHLVRLRELQDETGGFGSFIPLAFHPANTDLDELPGTDGIEDLKMLAVSRLMLDNFRNIKAFWIMLGIKVAQISLHFGVNDIDGTVVEEKITHAAGAETEEAIAKAELIRLIRDAGRVPVERGTLYDEIRRY
ncbi:MAG: aminofutalosine synthase MqnE [Actinobacteria bacterium]|nr:aminofutalosine synthase MqnE [Actinomycetota bacterium]MCL5883052.1 aminofutalosine synthase MqnE [Actinomycetota bacterium]